MLHGVTLQGVYDPQAFGGIAREVESLGFDDLWLTDSSLHAGDPYVYATLALSATSRVVVGTAVTNPLTRHPALTANVFRTLQLLAPGRVMCGIGAGDRPIFELGLRPAKLATLAETVPTLRQLWRGEAVDGAVGMYRFESSRLLSAVPEPPIYVAASGPKTLELAGELGDGVIVFAGHFSEGIDFACDNIQRGRERNARSDARTICYVAVSIDEDEATAIDAARPLAAWFAETSPNYARLAGMSDDLIAAVKSAYTGGEFQQAVQAGRLIPNEIVCRLALAGTPLSVEGMLATLYGRQDVLSGITVFPLGSDKLATLRAFARIVGIART